LTDPSYNIGEVLKKTRFERGLTLEDASGLTGVSKAMLGQIERGESNPTISVLWKISTGLKISFSEFLNIDSENYEPLSIKNMSPVSESEGKMELYNIFPYNPISGFEYYYVKLIPGAKHTSEPHYNFNDEYIVVTEGTLLLTVENKSYELEAPMAFMFKSNKNHSYSNPYDKDVVFQNILK
jgi:transcriptional regulator with XRE-family HTH domain